MQFKSFLNEMFSDRKRWDEYQDKVPMLKAGVDVLRKITAKGYEALIVGGAVRDIYMGKTPKDIDIATNMPIEQIEKIWKAVDIGKSRDFGIVTIKHKDFDFEVAQFREDGVYLDGRRPESVKIVQNFKSDASRRDFTFNAMGINKDGVIIDHFECRKAINSKIVQTVGNPLDRFEEDRLRMLRVVRLANRFDFKIHNETKQAIKDKAYTITEISPERVRDELIKMASQSGDKFANAILLLDEIGILKIILPEIVKLKDFKHNIEHHPEGAYVRKILSK